MITVTNRKTNATEDGIYIGRPSPLGNPYFLTQHTREEALLKYRTWLKIAINSPSKASYLFWNLVRRVENGESIELVCWCKPLPCHGDIIKEEIERQIKIGNSYNNYLSHLWKSAISDFETGERTAECVNCGCEYKGDPREFDWLEYPTCKGVEL